MLGRVVFDSNHHVMVPNVTTHAVTERGVCHGDCVGEVHSHGHHLFDPKLRPGGKSEPKTTSTHES